MAEVKIDMSSLDNSFETRIKREKEQENHLAPIVTRDKIVSTKPSLGKRFKNAFFSEDMKDVSDYIFMDIVIPGLQNAVIDTLERMFFGSSRGGSRRRDRDSYSRTSYSSYYRSNDRDRDRRRRDRDRDDYDDRRDEKIDYRNIVVTHREDAEEIVRTLRNYINDYDAVSVSMLLDLIGEAGRYTDNNYGWTRVEDICVKRVRNGYLIDVPEAEYLGD